MAVHGGAETVQVREILPVLIGVDFFFWHLRQHLLSNAGNEVDSAHAHAHIHTHTAVSILR